MTERQNTNNPIPSNELSDLNDNTIIIDEFTNSKEDYTKDRFGNEFKTRDKILTDLQKAVDDISSGAGFLPITGGTVTGSVKIEETLEVKENLTVKGMPVTTYIGEFRNFPFRKNKLPRGWYPRDGKLYDLNSEVGKVLNSLDEEFKGDWRIKVTDGKINIPNAFDENLNGYFERPVDGDKRQVGNFQDDAIRNITGEFIGTAKENTSSPTGCFSRYSMGTVGGYWNNDFPTSSWINTFKASYVVPTADENRPKNIGITPAIYLGV